MWKRHRIEWVGLWQFTSLVRGAHANQVRFMNEARLRQMPFWGPSEAVLFLIERLVS